MKVRASINKLTGSQNNIRNAIGFLEVQDGILETAGKVLNENVRVKGYATQDPLKSETDVASYNNEFKDLQQQLYDISNMTFNGQSLFSDKSTSGGTAYFAGAAQDASEANQISIHTSSQGSAGSKVLIHRSLLLSALTIKNSDGADAKTGSKTWSDVKDTTTTTDT